MKSKKTKYNHPFSLMVEFYAGHPMGLKSKVEVRTFRYKTDQDRMKEGALFQRMGVRILKEEEYKSSKKS